MPPAVEEALVAEEAATESISEASRDGGVSENNTEGLADPVESAGEIAPEEDPTTSYRGAQDRQEQASDDLDDASAAVEPDVPEAGRAASGSAEGVPGGGEPRPGEEAALSEETASDESGATATPGEPEPSETEPSGEEAARDEAQDNDETEEK